MEFLVRGAVAHGEPGVFMAFEETETELQANVASLGFDPVADFQPVALLGVIPIEEPFISAGLAEHDTLLGLEHFRVELRRADEVGQGVVPDTASGRRFRDVMGRLNADVAASSSAPNEVYGLHSAGTEGLPGYMMDMDVNTGAAIYNTGDTAYQYIGHKTKPLDGTSPRNLKAETVGDVLNVIPPHRAADIAHRSGLITANERWCGIDWVTSKRDPADSSKPLIEVGGTPMLELVARRLIAAGVDRLIINTHHLGEQIVERLHPRRLAGLAALLGHSRPIWLNFAGGKSAATGLGVLSAASGVARTATAGWPSPTSWRDWRWASATMMRPSPARAKARSLLASSLR